MYSCKQLQIIAHASEKPLAAALLCHVSQEQQTHLQHYMSCSGTFCTLPEVKHEQTYLHILQSLLNRQELKICTKAWPRGRCQAQLSQIMFRGSFDEFCLQIIAHIWHIQVWETDSTICRTAQRESRAHRTDSPRPWLARLSVAEPIYSSNRSSFSV